MPTFSRACYLVFLVIHGSLLILPGCYAKQVKRGGPSTPESVGCQPGDISCQQNLKAGLVPVQVTEDYENDPTTVNGPDDILEDYLTTTTLRPETYILHHEPTRPDEATLETLNEEFITENVEEGNLIYWFDFLDILSADGGALDFYEPADVVKEGLYITNNTKAYAENRKPFVKEVNYSFSEKVPLESRRGHVQDRCECVRGQCNGGFALSEDGEYSFTRHQELCFRKGESKDEHYQYIERLRQVCSWMDVCFESYFSQALCYDAVVKQGLTTPEKYGLLLFHNLLRARRAEGSTVGHVKGDRKEVPAMMELEWDPVLADKAQRLVNSCAYNNDCSYCRNTDFTGNVGQVLVSVISNHTIELDVLLERIMSVSRMNITNDEPFRGENGSGLLAQMLWESTTSVGCGLLQHQLKDGQHVRKGAHLHEGSPQEEFIETLLVCNYYPAGNLIGQPVMRNGPACSGCPSVAQCSAYSKVLCSRYHSWDMSGPHTQEADQFFALTDEEQYFRIKIIDLLFRDPEVL